MNIAFPEIGAAALSNAVLVLPLAVLVVVVCRLVNRPAVAWCLWGLVLLKFVTPAWYPCVPTRWAQTPGVSPGRSALNWVEPLPLVSEQAELKHRVSPWAMSQDVDSSLEIPSEIDGTPDAEKQSPPSSPAPQVQELVAPSDIAVDVAEPTIDGLAPTDDPAGSSRDGASEQTEAAATNVAPTPPQGPEDFPAEVPLTVAESVPLPLMPDRQSELPVEPSDSESRALARPIRSSQEGSALNPASGPIGGFTPPARRAVDVLVPVGIGVWAIGALVLLTLAGTRVWRFRKLLRLAEPAPVELVDRARELAAKLGCRSAPALRVTNGRVPPLLWGLGRRAVILLPRGLLDELDDEQRSALLAHELAHFARRDHWMRWFELAVRSLYWWHPVAWWAGRRLREAEEQCCDAWVVRLMPDSSRRYADALLKTVDYLAAAPGPVPTLATGITSVRRSLRPFHRRLTMIIEQRPNPRLSWPARFCLLALAGVVLPASIVAVAEDDAAEEQKPPVATEAQAREPYNHEPLSSGAEKKSDDTDRLVGSPEEVTESSTKTQPPVLRVPDEVLEDDLNPAALVQVFILKRADAAEAFQRLEEKLRYAATKPVIKLDEYSNAIWVRGPEPSVRIVAAVLADIDKLAADAAKDDHSTSETITVVRAQYVLPKKVAEAFDRFIQQHGERFEFLMSNTSTSNKRGRLRAMPASGLGPEEMMGIASGMGFDPSTLGGMAASGLDPSMLSGLGGMAVLGGRGGPSMGRLGGATSQLTIIATPEVQQAFGRFIKALTAVQQPKPDPADDDDAPETLTLTRVHYKLRRTPASNEFGLLGDGSIDPVGQVNPFTGHSIKGGAAHMILGNESPTSQPTLGDALFNLLTAVKESNLVPLLLVTADGDRLTVTTTEDFQQQLGKFIRFLQEHEPRSAGDEQLQSQSAADRKSKIIAEKSRQAAEMRRREAGELLKRARELLAEGDFDGARRLASEVAKSNVQYELFTDRPELVLTDIERAEAAAGDESAAVDSRTGRLMFGARLPATSTRSRLSELRGQERELSALLDVVADSLREDANRTPLLLVISQFYGDSAAGTSLIEMFNKLVELEMKKGEFVRSYGLQHPKVIEIQAKIDSQRRAFGLPTGADAKPVDLLDVYIQALKRQLVVTRKIVGALEDEIPDAFRAPQPEKLSN